MKYITLLVTLFISLLITACGGGTSGSDKDQIVQAVTKAPTTQAPTGSLSISWDIPTTRVNNDVLPPSEIGGYNVYLATNKNFIPSTPYTTINNRAISDHIIYNLSGGTYYVYITTFDTNGDESPYSDPLTKTI